MTYKRAAIFLALVILPAVVFAGGKQEPLPPLPQQSRMQQQSPQTQPLQQQPVVREAGPGPEPPKGVPARPVTRDIMELIGKSAYDSGDLQYFISSGITLEWGKGMQIDIEIKDGEGLIQETNAHETIIVPKDTGGVLISEGGPPRNPRTLKISFDDDDDRTLTFRENPADGRFYLVFREDRQYGEFTEYGNTVCKVIFSGEIPYLYVRLDETTNNQPKIKELRGRFVRPRETLPEAAAVPEEFPEDPPEEEAPAALLTASDPADAEGLD